MALTPFHPPDGAFSPVGEEGWATRTDPLGAHVIGASTTFAVYSRHATQVLLEIYTHPLGEKRRYDYWMHKGPDDIWRARLAAVPAGTLYGFRCWGPNWEFSPQWDRGNSAAGFITDVDSNGNRFNPNKLLFDPYARELSHDRETPEMKVVHGQDAGMYGSGPDSYAGAGMQLTPVVRREFDTGPWAPKAVVIHDTTAMGPKPGLPQKDAIIYEAHVRGLTRHRSSMKLAELLRGSPGFEDVQGVPDELRGTYAGAGRMAKYLRALGFNAVEFLPVHEFANDLNPEGTPGWDRSIDDPPHGNYWGYMTYGFFAPDLRYAFDKSRGGPTREFAAPPARR